MYVICVLSALAIPKHTTIVYRKYFSSDNFINLLMENSCATNCWRASRVLFTCAARKLISSLEHSFYPCCYCQLCEHDNILAFDISFSFFLCFIWLVVHIVLVTCPVCHFPVKLWTIYRFILVGMLDLTTMERLALSQTSACVCVCMLMF